MALLNHLRRYLDFIILRIGLHESSVHIARLLTLCAFAIAYANQGQTFTVDSLALFASTSQTYSMFLDSNNKSFSQGLLTAACDPNFRRFAIQHRWHEHSESALVSLLHACVGPKTTRLLNAVLSCLEDLEFILVRMQPAMPALRLALCLTPALTSTVARRTQAFSAVASFHSRATTMPFSYLCAFGSLTGPRRALQQPCHHVPQVDFSCAHPFCNLCFVPRMGIVSSMTEENQAALTAMLAALRERTASRSSSPLPEAALPTDESSTLPPEGASSTQDLPAALRPCQGRKLLAAVKTKSLGPTSSHLSTFVGRLRALWSPD